MTCTNKVNGFRASDFKLPPLFGGDYTPICGELRYVRLLCDEDVGTKVRKR
jgi:hypothetical protein